MFGGNKIAFRIAKVVNFKAVLELNRSAYAHFGVDVCVQNNAIMCTNAHTITTGCEFPGI